MFLNPLTDRTDFFWSELTSDILLEEFDYLSPVDGCIDDIATSPYYDTHKISEEHGITFHKVEKKPEKDPKRNKHRKKKLKLSKRAKWSSEEDEVIVNLYLEKGSNWKFISSHLEGRSPNLIKNRFYGTLKKKLTDDQNRIITTNKLKREDYFLKEHKMDDLTKSMLFMDNPSSSSPNTIVQSLSASQCIRNQLSNEEKRLKVKELYGKIAVIQAILTKTEREISVFK